jgi:hypothetical protein
MRITLSTLVYIIAFSTTLTHDLIIDVVMRINEIVNVQRSDHQTRSSKNQQRKEKEYTYSDGYG